MRFFIPILVFLLSVPAFSGPITPAAAVPSLTVGGRVFTDTTNLITLMMRCAGSSTSTLRTPTGTAGYQVTSGKTLTIAGLKVCGNAATGGTNFITLQSQDNDTGYAGGAGTNPKAWGGSTSVQFYDPGIGTCVDVNPNFGVPSQKYLACSSNTGTDVTIWAYGYEQ